MLGEKVFISKHGETIITKCSNENNYKSIDYTCV